MLAFTTRNHVKCLSHVFPIPVHLFPFATEFAVSYTGALQRMPSKNQQMLRKKNKKKQKLTTAQIHNNTLF